MQARACVSQFTSIYGTIGCRVFELAKIGGKPLVFYCSGTKNLISRRLRAKHDPRRRAARNIVGVRVASGGTSDSPAGFRSRGEVDARIADQAFR
jgi:hypothetical protein